MDGMVDTRLALVNGFPVLYIPFRRPMAEAFILDSITRSTDWRFNRLSTIAPHYQIALGNKWSDKASNVGTLKVHRKLVVGTASREMLARRMWLGRSFILTRSVAQHWATRLISDRLRCLTSKSDLESISESPARIS